MRVLEVLWSIEDFRRVFKVLMVNIDSWNFKWPTEDFRKVSDIFDDQQMASVTLVANISPLRGLRNFNGQQIVLEALIVKCQRIVLEVLMVKCQQIVLEALMVKCQPIVLEALMVKRLS